MATPKENLEHLTSLLVEPPTIDVVLAARGKGEALSKTSYRLVNMSSDAKGFFAKVAKTAVADAAPNWVLRPFDLLCKADPHEVEYLTVSSSEAPRATVSSALSSPGGLPVFSGDDSAFMGDLRFSVVILGATSEKPVYLFRVFTKANELKRKPGTALISHNGMYSRLEENVLLFTEQIDCVLIDEHLFVISKGNYRKIFDEFAEIEKKSREAASVLQSVVPIANFSDFEDACASQIAMADKLIAVSKRPYFVELTVSKLEPIIKEFELEVKINSSGEMIFDPTPKGRWHILKLIDDDYLRSSMTENLYEVNSKSQR